MWLTTTARYTRSQMHARTGIDEICRDIRFALNRGERRVDDGAKFLTITQLSETEEIQQPQSRRMWHRGERARERRKSDL